MARIDGLTIPIAKYVYDGNVIALEGDQSTLDELATEVNHLHLTNVVPQLIENDDIEGTDLDTDGIVVIDALHNTRARRGCSPRWLSCCQAAGWLLIADWFSTDARGDTGPAKSKRVDPSRVERWASEHDMTPITRRTLGVQRYVHVYRKRRTSSN